MISFLLAAAKPDDARLAFIVALILLIVVGVWFGMERAFRALLLVAAAVAAVLGFLFLLP